MKDYRWNTIGVLLHSLISPLFLVSVTRINGIHISGMFSFCFAASVFFWAIAMWGGRTFQVSDLNKEFKSVDYILARLFLAGTTIILSILFCALNGYTVQKSGLLLLLVLFKATESVADSLYGVMQKHGYLYKAGKSLVVKAGLGFVLFILVDIFTKNILMATAIVLITNITVLVFYDFRFTARLESLKFSAIPIAYQLRRIMYLLRRCSPVFVVTFLAMFSLYIPRYFVDRYHESQTSYFGILSLPVTLLVLMITFILQPNIVPLSKAFLSHNTSKLNGFILRMFGVTLALGTLGVIIANIFGPMLLKLVFGVEFYSYKRSLTILILGATFNALVGILVNILIIMRQIKGQVSVLVLSNSLLIAVSAWGIRKYAVDGASSLFAITALTQMLTLYFYYLVSIRRLVNEKD